MSYKYKKYIRLWSFIDVWPFVFVYWRVVESSCSLRASGAWTVVPGGVSVCLRSTCRVNPFGLHVMLEKIIILIDHLLDPLKLKM